MGNVCFSLLTFHSDLTDRTGRNTAEEEAKTNWRNSPTWDFLARRSPRTTGETGSESDTEKYPARL